jgi:DHA1 family bicyclomycin/chloramphenicol resistance-like MFS transporter
MFRPEGGAGGMRDVSGVRGLPGVPRHLGVLIAMTSICGFMATDIFLPAIPALKQEYGRTASEIQALFSVFLYALAAGQLVHGALADAIGRRTPLLLSLTLYSVASLAIPYTAHYELVLFWRVVQAFGACGAIVVGRAVAADFHAGPGLARFFLNVSVVVGMSPALAPAIGQLLYSGFGWEACFQFTAAFGAGLWVLAWATVPKGPKRPKRPKEPAGRAMPARSIGGAVRRYAKVLGTPAFRLNATVIAISQAAYFAYLAESAFLLLHQGWPYDWLGYTYASLAFAYVAGNLAARSLAPRIGPARVYSWGISLFLCAGIFLAAGMALRPASTAIMLAGVSALTFANGFLLPLGTAAAIGAVPGHAGSAAGMAGFIQLSCAALAAQCIGPLTAHQPAAFGAVMLALGLTNSLLYLAHRRRHP